MEASGKDQGGSVAVARALSGPLEDSTQSLKKTKGEEYFFLHLGSLLNLQHGWESHQPNA